MLITNTYLIRLAYDQSTPFPFAPLWTSHLDPHVYFCSQYITLLVIVGPDALSWAACRRNEWRGDLSLIYSVCSETNKTVSLGSGLGSLYEFVTKTPSSIH